MKRILLFSAAVAFAAAGFAQQVTSAQQKVQKLAPQMNVQMKAVTGNEVAKQPQRSYASGVYFSKPEGAFYVGYGLDNYGYIQTALAAPMMKDIKFVNPTGKGSWYVNGNAATAAYLDGTSYVFNAPYGSPYFYAPVLKNDLDSFGIGTNNIYAYGYVNGDTRFTRYADYVPGIISGLIGPIQEVSVLLPYDDHSAYEYMGKIYSNSQSWGSLTTNFMYGYGDLNYTDDDGNVVATGTSFAVGQYMGKTAGPLYVEAVGLKGLTHSTPLKDGVTLTAYITGVQLDTLSNGTIQKSADWDNVIETLTATVEDTIDFSASSSFTLNDKTVYSGALRFTKKTVDEFGTETAEPFVIPEGTEFAVFVPGFDQDGVDLGVDAYLVPDEDNCNPGQFYVSVDGEVYTHFYTGCSAQLSVLGLYDGVYAPEQPGFYEFENENLKYNVVRVSGSGDNTVNLTDGANDSAVESETGDGLPGAFVMTATSFFDEEENSNYEPVDLPDWITGVNVEALSSNYNVYLVSFKVDELPAGTTGRAAKVCLQGKGVTSEPIIVLQGDATVTDGINGVEISNNNVKISGETYNVNGQKVGKSYKGLVINNGKKFIQK